MLCRVNRRVSREILSLVLKYFNVLVNILKYHAEPCVIASCTLQYGGSIYLPDRLSVHYCICVKEKKIKMRHFLTTENSLIKFSGDFKGKI